MEVAGLQYALILFVQKLNSVKILVTFDPPYYNLTHDGTLRLDPHLLQRHVTEEF